MTVALAILSAAIMAVLNAVRGSGYQWLRFVIAAVAGAVSWLAGTEPVEAAVLGACVFIFMIQPWGRWYTLNRKDRDLNPADWYERAIEWLSDLGGVRRDWLAWGISAALFTLPLIVLVSPWWAVLPALMLAVYEISWRTWTGWVATTPIRLAEFYKGAVLGLLCVILAGCATYTERSPYWSGVAREVGRTVND